MLVLGGCRTSTAVDKKATLGDVEIFAGDLSSLVLMTLTLLPTATRNQVISVFRLLYYESIM